MSDKEYDALGRLSKEKRNGNPNLLTGYAYNIRSWLKEISGVRFSQNLYYNSGGSNSAKCYNGNISSMTWQGIDGATQGYQYTYDALNRMLNASYGQGAALTTSPNRFTEQVTGYDKNGNILGLKRYGRQTATAYGLIDNLSMTLNGNRLKEVKDFVATPAYNGGFEFKDYTAPKDTGGSGSIFDPPARLPEDEFGFDSNGNLTKDLNKNISSIQYNVLNLPSKIFFKDGNSISYLYGADGVKYRTIHKIGGITTITDYCGNVIYENGTQKQLLTEAGYISLSDKKYHYYLQDHQGNNRVVINQTGGVEETNHYYPFGGVFSSTSSVQPYKYNGKELDTKNGLNWYDYGARQYDAALGRWHAVDPLSEKYFRVSPYVYCKNSPINRIDLNGEDDFVITPRGRLWNMTPKQERGKSKTDRLYNSSGAKVIERGDKFIEVSDTHLLSSMFQRQNGYHKGYATNGCTQNLNDAANVFKFAADNTNAEWRLDVYDNEGVRTAVLATKQDADHVQSADVAKKDLPVKGNRIISIHSHPSANGTRGGSPRDLNNAKLSPARSGVYFKGDETLYEYDSTHSNIKENPIQRAIELINSLDRIGMR